MTHIFVTVTGGVADVDRSTVPDGVEVHIIDYDNIKTVPPNEREGILMPTEVEYIKRVGEGDLFTKW